MNELQFVLAYIGLILVGSCILTGFYIISKADKEIEPDGSVKYYGKVLKNWGRFLTQEKDTHRIYFFKASLDKKRFEIERSNPKLKGRLQLDVSGHYLKMAEGTIFNRDDNYAIEMANRVKADIEGDKMFLYEEKTIYLFPEWMRMTLGGCLPCSSSILGSLVYWSFVWLQPGAFLWTGHPLVAVFICWLGYCLALVPVNMIVHRKTF